MCVCVYIYISCSAASTDLPDPLSLPVSIVHRSREVFKPLSCISTGLLYTKSFSFLYLFQTFLLRNFSFFWDVLSIRKHVTILIKSRISQWNKKKKTCEAMKSGEIQHIKTSRYENMKFKWLLFFFLFFSFFTSLH